MAEPLPAVRDSRSRPFDADGGHVLHGMRRVEDSPTTPATTQTELADAHTTKPDTPVKTGRAGRYDDVSVSGNTTEAFGSQRSSPSQTQGSSLPKSPLGEWSEHDVAELAEWLELGEDTIGKVVRNRVNGNLMLDVLALEGPERNHILEHNFAVTEPWSRVQLIRTVQELADRQGGHITAMATDASKLPEQSRVPHDNSTRARSRDHSPEASKSRTTMPQRGGLKIDYDVKSEANPENQDDDHPDDIEDLGKTSYQMVLGERTVKAPILPRITTGNMYSSVQWQLYCTGAKVWADMSSTVFGDWIMQIYHDPDTDLKSIANKMDNLGTRIDKVWAYGMWSEAAENIRVLFVREKDRTMITDEGAHMSGLAMASFLGRRINRRCANQFVNAMKGLMALREVSYPKDLDSRLDMICQISE